MTKFALALAFLVFAASGTWYLVVFFKFYKELKSDSIAWERAGSPDVLNVNGQAKIISLLFAEARNPSATSLTRRAILAKNLLIVAVVSFVVYLSLAIWMS